MNKEKIHLQYTTLMQVATISLPTYLCMCCKSGGVSVFF